MSATFEQCRSYIERCFWSELIVLITEDPSVANEIDEYGDTLLSIAAHQAGSLAALQTLVHYGADVNYNNYVGASVLAETITGGSTFGLTTIEELKFLLSAGADIHARADCGKPPLHWAITCNRLIHAEILLEHGANPDQVTMDLQPESAWDIARRMKSNDALELLERHARLDKQI
jgi:Ankyrin repeat